LVLCFQPLRRNHRRFSSSPCEISGLGMRSGGGWPGSKSSAQDLILFNSFGVGDGIQNGVQSSDAKGIVVGNRDAVMAGFVGFQNDVAAFLIYTAVSKAFAEVFDQLRSGKVAGQLHAGARTSSRTRCSRMLAGLG